MHIVFHSFISPTQYKLKCLSQGETQYHFPLHSITIIYTPSYSTPYFVCQVGPLILRLSLN